MGETLKEHALRLIKEIQDCPENMGAHCIQVLCDELEPLLETLPDAAALKAREADIDTCEWKNDGDDSWWTACGEGFVFTDGGPKENHQKFCGYCGKTLVENRMEETYAEDE